MSDPTFADPVTTKAEPAPVRHDVLGRTQARANTDPAQLLGGLTAKYDARPDAVHAGGPIGSDHGEGAIVASLRAARHALDETPAGAKKETFKSQARIARTHVDQAIQVKLYVPKAPDLDSHTRLFAHALLVFLERASSTHGPAIIDELTGLKSVYAELKSTFHLAEFTRLANYQPELGSDASYVVAALPGAIDAFHVVTDNMAIALKDSKGERARDSIVEGRSPELAEMAGYINWLVAQAPTTAFAPLRPRAKQVAQRVQDVLGWIRSRPGHGPMASNFQPVVTAIDEALVRLGLPKVDSYTPDVGGGELYEGQQENQAVGAEKDELISQLGALETERKNGIKRFEDHEKLEDEDQPSFLLELAKAVIGASIGHVGGMLAARFAAGVAKRLVDAEAGRIIAKRISDSKLADVTTDSVQGIIGTAMSGGLAHAAGKNERHKAKTFFIESRTTEVAAWTTKYVGELKEAITANLVSLETIRSDRATLLALKKEAAELYFTECAKSWALYLAQSRLTRDEQRGTDKGRYVSSMDRYFGPTPSTDHSGGDGVLQVKVRIQDDPTTASEPEIEIVDYKIKGLNEELERPIINDARGVLAKIYLPKEINIEFFNTGPTPDDHRPSTGHEDTVPVGGGSQWARLAVDERNTVRDDTGWIQLLPSGGRDKVYRDPRKLWDRIKNWSLTHAWKVANTGSRP